MNSATFRLPHPRRNVPFPLKKSPNIDVIVTFYVEDQIWIAPERPGSQTRQFQLAGITQRTRCWMAGKMIAGVLQRIDETECSAIACLTQIVVDGLFNIPIGLFSQDDRLADHVVGRVRTRSRKRSK